MDHASRARTIRNVAVAIGVIAFGFRVLTVRDLTNDHYMHLAWAQQVLFGQLPGRDFVDPGMPLMYVLSAIVQAVWPGPFSEAVLTCVLMAIAAVATFIVAADLSGSVVVGAMATLFEIVLEPRLYSYPKILVPAVALLLVQQYIRQPSRRRLIYLALWTAVAVLLRHDLGVYAAAGIGTALVTMNAPDWRRTIRALFEYAAALIAIMSPYVVYVMWSEGLVEHLHAAVEFAKGEAHQRFLTPPAFPFWSASGGLASWNQIDSAVFLFYAAHLLAVAALAVFVASSPERRDRRPVAAAGIAMLLMYLVVVLRHPIDSRVRDVGALLSIMTAWVLTETGWNARFALRERSLAARTTTTLAFAATVAVTAAGAASIWMLAGVGDRVRETHVMDGISSMTRTFASTKQAGTVWPWERFWPAGEMPEAVRYVNACTTPDEAVLMTWAAPEYYFFAKRRFAAGHALFLPPDAFTTPHDQDRMLAQIRVERIPIALINETRRMEFADAYGEVDRYIRQEYVPAGHFRIREGSDVTIAIRRGVQPEKTYGPDRWPCGFASRAASRTASTMLDGSAIPFPAMSNAVP